MEPRYPALFQPIEIGGVLIKNRLVVPAIGSLLCPPGGYVCDRLIEYLEERARGGFGLIIVEGSVADPLGKGGPKQFSMEDDSFIPGFRRLVDRVHGAGARIALQLMHAGRSTHPKIIKGQQPIAPSAVADPVIRQLPREMTQDDIDREVASFARAARRCQEAGFDAVEIHGGHGYLVSQFMSGYANKRTDEYGGGFEGFLRFPLEIIRRTRELCGPEYPIIFRISADEAVPLGRTLEESVAVAERLVQEGVSAIHVSIGVYESSHLTMASPDLDQGFNGPAAAVIKAAVSVPVIAVGRINDPAVAEEIITSGKADMVAIGRQSLADPEWPLKAAENRLEDIVKCLSCNEGCLASGWKAQPICCVQNPALGREGEYASGPSDKPQKILIAGGGPAGLEAARTAALRGHQVTLFEKGVALGGQALIAYVPPGKGVWKDTVLSRVKAIEQLGVEVNLGKELTPSMVKEMRPDVLIIATGSAPLVPDIPGVDRPLVLTAREVLNGEPVGDRVLVIGAGSVGCETADYLAQRGKEVTIVEALGHLARDSSPAARYHLLGRLTAKGVRILTSATVKEIGDNSVTVGSEEAEEVLTGIDNVILAAGVTPVSTLEAKAREHVAEVHLVGDAAGPGKMLEAVQQAIEITLKI